MRTWSMVCVVLAVSLRANVATGEEGFLPLFNGKDLSGWVPVNVAPSTFTVRDGMIISTGIPTGVMRTEKMYENFILELEWKHLKKDGNAGLFVFSDAITSTGVPFTRSIEIQIIDSNHPEGWATSHGDVFAIHGASFVPDRPHPRGWMRCLPSEKRAHSFGNWNHYRVECRDGVVSLAVNGKVVSGGSRCNPRKGYICLEAEGSECHFRNIRIKELPSTDAPSSETANPDAGFKSIYTGVDLSNWMVEAGHQKHWRPRDWILSYDGRSEAGDKNLYCARQFKDVVVMVDVRYKDKLPSSVAPVLVNGLAVPLELKDPTRWNRIVIEARGEVRKVTVNGEPTATGPARPFTGAARQRIGLMDEGREVDFANIYVKALPAAE